MASLGDAQDSISDDDDDVRDPSSGLEKRTNVSYGSINLTSSEKTPTIKDNIQIDKRNITTNDNDVSKTNSNSAEEFPDCLKRLLRGIHVWGDSKVLPDSKPEWLDMDKYRKGQEFAKKNWGGLWFGTMLSFMVGISFRRFMETLIFTAVTDTPFKAFKRYLFSINKISSWYEGDIFDVNDPAHEDIKKVRSMHARVMDKMNSMEPDELKKKITFQGPDGICKGMWCNVDNVIEEFKDVWPSPVSRDYPYNVLNNTEPGTTTYISQFDMAMTQVAFMGVVVMHPDKCGIHDVTREEMEGFIHFWRCVGYLMGAEDKYNACSGTLEETLELMDSVEKFWVSPGLRDLDRDGEHITRCFIEGVGYFLPLLLYNTSLAYFCHIYAVTDGQCSKLLKALTWMERVMLVFTKLLFGYFFYVPCFRLVANWFARKKFHTGNNAIVNNSSWLTAKKGRYYSYQVERGCEIK